MKRGVIWIALSCLMVASLVLASCTTKTTSSTSTPTSTTKTTTTTTNTTTTKTTTPPTTTATTTATTGNWWDSLGKPQYGGEMVFRLNSNIASFDPYQGEAFMTIQQGWLELLFADDWTLDPAVWDYKISFRPNEYVKGQLAESWEFPVPNTFILHLRKGIHWQDISPVNGREFTADDVVYHFNRLFGLGGGFTKPGQYWGTVVVWKDLISVTATDKYTVAFNFKTPNPENIMETLQAPSVVQGIEAREAVDKWGDVTDWHHAIGTGPFILTDFVSGSSATLAKNPNYWGYDERYPQNKLPYVDTVKYLIIPDSATTLSALRTGKIDLIDGIPFQDALNLQKTNPEILQLSIPAGNTVTLNPRNDTKPFNDIRVRKALQMAIDLPTIASTYYAGTALPFPSTLTSMYMKGWGFPYDQWPQDLKDEYAYNPTAAKKLLADAGFPDGFKTNIVVATDCDLNLLQVVKSYFAAVGIDMEIRPMDPAAWASFVLTLHKNDALSQRSSGAIGLSFYPFRQITRFQTGNSSNVVLVSDPVYDAFYPKAMAATNVDDIKNIMKDMNEYVARQHYVISLLQPNLFALYQPWFKGYMGQYGVTGSVGPQLLFFYPARFWIDQKLKKSMGH